jgi:hypothetical protein
VSTCSSLSCRGAIRRVNQRKPATCTQTRLYAEDRQRIEQLIALGYSANRSNVITCIGMGLPVHSFRLSVWFEKEHVHHEVNV